MLISCSVLSVLFFLVNTHGGKAWFLKLTIYIHGNTYINPFHGTKAMFNKLRICKANIDQMYASLSP